MTTDRRTFLGAGLGATATIASCTHGLMGAAQADPDHAQLAGDISWDPSVRAAAAGDFGGMIHKQPRAVFKPASAADIARLMQWARDRGLKVAARGQGHSIYGRALAEDGVVIDMGAIDKIHHVQPDRIVVDAGATWKTVFEATMAQGLTPPVLTNYLGLSVGGTLAVGGIGPMSSRHGMQTDHVSEFDVVTGDGRELTCSATSNADLFNAVRAGLGQCGVVTRATLDLVRAPERVRRYQLFYRDLASLTADQRRALNEARFDQVQGAILPGGSGGWQYQLEGAVFYGGEAPPDDRAVLSALSDDRKLAIITDVSYRDDALAFAKFEQLLRSKGQWTNPQPWLLTFLRGSNAEQIAGEVLDGMSAAHIGPFGRMTYYPLRTSAFRTPLVRLPDEEIVFPFNLIRIPASNDPLAAGLMVAQNRTLYDRIRKAGGVLYPVSAFSMSPADWQDHFGPRWPQLSEAKRCYDPANLLTPGYNLF
ncbi:FAD-binding protein [Bradyrhizobium sp. LjRoot220]|uniref:FAD-binding protein n=1 Tax=Bradyrhizobium sp. LjRoot220 TaxID=3342284 RepID=UPI003ECCCC62